MGMSDKKTTTDSTSTKNSTQTTTPNVPDWISQPTQNLAGGINALIGSGSTAFTPQTSDLQQQAFDTAGGLKTPDYSAPMSTFSDLAGFSAPNISADQVTGQSLLDNLSKYYDPFKDQVLNPAMADFDYQAGQTRAGQAAQAAAGRAFQGSRYGIQEAQTEGDLARARAATEGGLLQGMYTQATGLSATDAAARQQAMEANQSANLQAAQANAANSIASAGVRANAAASEAGLTTTQQQEALANLQAQSQLGAQKTELEQIKEQYPLTYQAQMEGLLSGLNPQLYTGSTVTGNETDTQHQTQTVSDPLGKISSLIGAASGFMPGGNMAGLFKGVTSGAQNMLGNWRQQLAGEAPY